MILLELFVLLCKRAKPTFIIIVKNQAIGEPMIEALHSCISVTSCKRNIQDDHFYSYETNLDKIMDTP
jgi:hypothetical protein